MGQFRARGVPQVCDLPVPAGDAARPEVPHEQPHRPEHVGVEVHLEQEEQNTSGGFYM